MASYGYLLAGIVILIIASYLLFTEKGTEIFAPSLNETDEELVGICFYLHFISYTLFLAGIILVIRTFIRTKE